MKPALPLLMLALWALLCLPPALAADNTAHGADRRDERLAMVSQQIAARGVRDQAVLAAMRAVPRHLFVPPPQRRWAYADHPLPIGHGQTISQPYIVAVMTEALGLRGGEKVLEVGTGSGYQAAVLAHLAARVYTIEIIPALARRAQAALAELGLANVQVRAGDGYQGWPDAAPFDAIIVTAAPEQTPQPLVDQLASGGRLVLPVGPRGGVQRLLLLQKDQQGRVSRRFLDYVRFVPLVRQPPPAQGEQ